MNTLETKIPEYNTKATPEELLKNYNSVQFEMSRRNALAGSSTPNAHKAIVETDPRFRTLSDGVLLTIMLGTVTAIKAAKVAKSIAA